MTAGDHTTNVMAAFEMLLEEVETEIEFVNNAGSRAFQDGNYERVEAAREQGLKLTSFRDQVSNLRKQWATLVDAFDVEADEDETTAAERRNLGRLKRGIRTPEDAFRLPILQTLVAMGGSGKVREILTNVEDLMRSALNETDYDPLPSTPNTSRWYNTAQWSRNTMVQEGLLRDDSPRGVWQISEAGRRYLQEQAAKRK